MNKRLIFLLVVAAIFVSDLSFGQGCSQCKLLAEQGSELDENSFGSNINYGIIFLMVIPYLLLMAFFHKQIIAFFKRQFGKKPVA